MCVVFQLPSREGISVQQCVSSFLLLNLLMSFSGWHTVVVNIVFGVLAINTPFPGPYSFLSLFVSEDEYTP